MRARSMNLRDLSRATGMPYGTLQAYLSGKRAIPAQAVVAICRALGISADVLLFGRPMLDRAALLRAIQLQEGIRQLSKDWTSSDVAANMLMDFYWRELCEHLSRARAISPDLNPSAPDRGAWFAWEPALPGADTSPDTSAR